jgi:serine/threonine protein kinase
VGPETIAGRYRVERAVGRGGMGAVWLCTDEVLGRQVAVKQVGTMPGEDALDVPRAMREARSLAALNHRNVVSVYDAVEEGDHIWLVMEYVPGRSLSELLAQQGFLPPERAAWIGAQVADGLAAAHERGTIHRDVKPGNILVTGTGPRRSATSASPGPLGTPS